MNVLLPGTRVSFPNVPISLWGFRTWYEHTRPGANGPCHVVRCGEPCLIIANCTVDSRASLQRVLILSGSGLGWASLDGALGGIEFL